MTKTLCQKLGGVLQKVGGVRTPRSPSGCALVDEKIFIVAPPVNLQKDCVYVPQSSKKRDVAADRLHRTRPTFSKSLMVSVAASKLGCTELIFVQPGANVNGAYYRDELLVKQMLPAIRQIAGDHFIFQQDSAPAHHRDTIEFLRRSTPQFITPDLWPPNSPGARFSKVPKIFLSFS